MEYLERLFENKKLNFCLKHKDRIIKLATGFLLLFFTIKSIKLISKLKRDIGNHKKKMEVLEDIELDLDSIELEEVSQALKIEVITSTIEELKEMLKNGIVTSTQLLSIYIKLAHDKGNKLGLLAQNIFEKAMQQAKVCDFNIQNARIKGDYDQLGINIHSCFLQYFIRFSLWNPYRCL